MEANDTEAAKEDALLRKVAVFFFIPALIIIFSVALAAIPEAMQEKARQDQIEEQK